MQELIQKIMFYHFSNGFPKEEQHLGNLTTKYSLEENFPLLFLGILFDLDNDNQFRYFNHSVSKETCDLLTALYATNQDQFILGFDDGLESLFLAFDSYLDLRDKKKELGSVLHENNTKSSIYRIPMYATLCESVLMNFFRFFASILSKTKNVDYTSQNTLGKIIPALKSNGFSLSTDININLRNAINHGTVIFNDTEVEFIFVESRKKTREIVSIWDLDRKIEDIYDIASGIVVGIFRFFSTHPEPIIGQFANIHKSEFKGDWFKILFHSHRIRCLDVDTEKAPGQVNLHIKTEIPEDKMLLLAIQILCNGLYLFYPDHDQYFIGYSHPRSLHGFLRLPKNDLLNDLSFSGDQIIMIHPISTQNVDIRKYNYFVFQEIHGSNWFLEKIEIISNENEKRLKARLILKERLEKNKINHIVKSIIVQMKNIYTPDNPKHFVKCGDSELDALFLTIFIEQNDRYNYTLFESNSFFVCIANYYKEHSTQRLDHGGIPVLLWNRYKKNTVVRVEYAWNVNYHA